jgi:hypothetical protein
MLQQSDWAPVLAIMVMILAVITVVHKLTRKNKCPRPLCMEVGKATEVGFTVVNPEGGRRTVKRACRYHGFYEVIEEVPRSLRDETTA